jgi:hypothetical protein
MEIYLTIALVVCTMAYTVINYMMLNESRIQRKLKARPYVIAYLKSTEDYNGLRLYIKNVGEGVARNIKGRTLQDYNRFGNEANKLSDAGLFKCGLDILPPGGYVSYYLDTWGNIRESDIESMFIEIEISCDGVDNAKHDAYFKLGFSRICGQGYANPPETYLGKIASSLAQIRNIKQSSIQIPSIHQE